LLRPFEFEKAATNLKGVAKLVAVNMDEHKVLIFFFQLKIFIFRALDHHITSKDFQP
jgi:hypothetical protein